LPRLGEHTEEILLSVGYTRKEIEGFKKEGVI
jgi:crotonobetainyl-CoA:carnitine CoA-transferase CaiB-like acyl-CoA transferase